MTQVKRSWRQVDGVLLLDKPIGLSSNDALQKARRLFSAAKGGHTGTLDPMATGLLPLCFGEATKFSADLLEADKTYEADILLGISTDSGDAEGKILAQQAVSVSDAEINAVIPRFLGEIEQIPPMHSALKRDGRPLYELARKGIEVERAPRQVRIEELSLLGRVADSVRVRVRCSKGTYIRSLAMDIGAALGCGAHLAALRRTEVGHLQAGDAVTLAELESLTDEERLAHLSPVDSLIRTLPVIHLDAEAENRFSHGNPVRTNESGLGLFRVYSGARLLGVGQYDAAGLLWPKRLVHMQ